MKPTRTSAKKLPPAASAPRAEDGNIRANENSVAASPRKKKRRLVGKSPQRKATQRKSEKGAAVRASPQALPEQKGMDRPRLAMGDALRRAGLDEVTLAEHFAATVQKLSTKNESGEGVAKLFVDTLKECTRHLDSPRGSSGAPAAVASANGTRVIVNLIHEVARPARLTPASVAAANASAAADAADEAAVAASEDSPP
jgi:hypothetical protein